MFYNFLERYLKKIIKAPTRLELMASRFVMNTVLHCWVTIWGKKILFFISFGSTSQYGGAHTAF